MNHSVDKLYTEASNNCIINCIVNNDTQELKAIAMDYGFEGAGLICFHAAGVKNKSIIHEFVNVLGGIEFALQIAEENKEEDIAAYLKSFLSELNEQKGFSERIGDMITPSADSYDGGGKFGEHLVMPAPVVYGGGVSKTDNSYFVGRHLNFNFMTEVDYGMKKVGPTKHFTLVCLRGISYPEVLESFNLLYSTSASMRSAAKQVYGTEDYGVIEHAHNGVVYGVVIALKMEWKGYVVLAIKKL